MYLGYYMSYHLIYSFMKHVFGIVFMQAFVELLMFLTECHKRFY